MTGLIARTGVPSDARYWKAISQSQSWKLEIHRLDAIPKNGWRIGALQKNIAQLEPKEEIPRLKIKDFLFVMRRAQMDILRTTARASVV